MDVDISHIKIFNVVFREDTFPERFGIPHTSLFLGSEASGDA
jgi:hypothetical protein